MNIKEMLLVPNPYSRPQIPLKKINGIVLHYIGNSNTSALSNRNYFNNLKDTHTTYASSHYIVGLDGEVLQLIPESEWAYCSNNRNFDTISIEVCHPDSTGKFNNKSYESAIELCADICKRIKLNPQKDIIRHYDVTGKKCPLYFVNNENEWLKFKNEVSKKMDNDKKEIISSYEALNIICENGILNSPDYWLPLIGKINNFDKLLINFANYIINK